MTHFGNYAQDRLAPYIFDRAFAFVQDWTNLQLKAAPPQELVARHLAFNPQEGPGDSIGEALPLHSDPCEDHRHAAIWPVEGCTLKGRRLPSAVILGPQKTGQHSLCLKIPIDLRLQSSNVLQNQNTDYSYNLAGGAPPNLAIGFTSLSPYL